MGYMLSWSPVTSRHRVHDERTVMLPAVVTSKLVSNLSEATEYAVVLSAVYPNIQTSPAPKLIIRTDYAVNELPIADDTFVDHKIECNCSEPGMLACTRTSLDSVECACYEGYQGRWCERCSPGFVKDVKECVKCPCSNITSTGVCDVDPRTGIPRCECLPGHRGAECNQCMPGYHRRSESTGCRPINCLSYSLCQEEPDRPGCQDCDFSVQLHESFSPVAQKSNADPFAQGTLTVIAILSGFCFLLFAATLATCYHHRRRAGLVALSNSPTYWNAMPPDAQQTFDCNEYIQMGPANGTLHRRENEGYGGYQATTKLAMQLVNQQGDRPSDYSTRARHGSLHRGASAVSHAAHDHIDTMVSLDNNDTTPKVARASSEDFCL
ncbi:multiple epidermal growth factor-like domains protein 9 isoform X2 [Varroa jacobsoni]|nr:multiple epidermal growth factor-like domains protein 9 isoform X2 [Varroa destructor]XP_022658222.1 multiple epidermal growth factor-like domains protein 9 isoform X2 [Varroa destructor]XP_022699252.1 multiple epidermal growth factor-like domains protein 9 isoform X2 [Varroa jacobsoni]